MPAWITRTELTGTSINNNGGGTHTCSFTPASSGNVLVAIVAGAVTFTTPTGWTLRTSGLNLGNVYVFTKTATSNEASFTTTHNDSDYAIKGIVYEFFAGTTYQNGNSATAQAATVTGPTVSSLTGNYTRFAARCWALPQNTTSASASWTLPTVEDYDSYSPKVNRDGIALTIAYDDASSGPSFSSSSTLTTTNGAASGEAVAFALTITASPLTPIGWVI